MAPFGCGVEVGVNDCEVGESLQGSPASAGGSLLDLDATDGSLGFIVGEGHRQVGGKPQDHVLVSAEPGDQGSRVGGKAGTFALVIGLSSGERAMVAVTQTPQRFTVKGVGTLCAGLACGLVGVDQGVGHRDRPQLSIGVGIGNRAQVTQQVSTAPGMQRLGQVGVAGIPIADGHR